MSRIIYQNFDLLIDHKDEKHYRAKVIGSGGGDAAVTFSIDDLQLPSSGPGTESGNEATDGAGSRHLVSGASPMAFPLRYGPPDFKVAKTLGGHLFEAVFKKDIYLALQRSRDQARKKKARLRIRLNLTDVPELACLPWEYLYNPDLNHFYAQFVETPIVRYLGLAEPIEELEVTEPLRVLVMIASPRDARLLDVQGEWQKLKDALKELEAQGLIELDLLTKATRAALQEQLAQRLMDRPYHVFHFIGHGVFDRETNEGRLLFEDDQGQGDLVSGRIIGTLLRDNDTLRLAIINACEGARISDTDAYAGIAQHLLRNARIPAVIAMQFEITDAAAITFAHCFYRALATGHPVDAALSHARKAIFVSGNEVEWATPVLYMRTDDGRLFDVKSRNGEREGHDSTPAGSGRAGVEPRRPALPPHPLDAHYRLVLDALLEGRLVPFLGFDINLYGRQSIKDWDLGQPLPSSSELAAYLGKVFEYPPGEVLDMVGVSQYAYVKTKGLGRLYDTLTRVFSGDYAPTPLHLFFASLPGLLHDKKYPRTADQLRRRFIIVTTNYDQLLETAFNNYVSAYHVVSYIAWGDQRSRFLHSRFTKLQPSGQATLEGRPTVIDSPSDYRGFADEDPIILKLPGALDLLTYEHKFAVIEDHYFDYLTHKDLTSLLPPQLTSKLKRSHHLFLGYSLRDWNWRALLYRIWEGQKPSYESWAIDPQPHDIDEKFWGACDVDIVRSSLKEYIEGLSERVQRI